MSLGMIELPGQCTSKSEVQIQMMLTLGLCCACLEQALSGPCYWQKLAALRNPGGKGLLVTPLPILATMAAEDKHQERQSPFPLPLRLGKPGMLYTKAHMHYTHCTQLYTHSPWLF